MRLMKNKSWKHRLYKAHESFDDFSNLLWPDQWNEKELREKRQEYIDDGSPEGYAQEYLNDPIAHSEAYFRKGDFKELDEEMLGLPVNYYASMDLAISDSDRTAYTVITIGGLDEFRRLQIRNVIRDRFGGDANEIINTMLEVQRLYNIEFWKIERGQIERTLMGPLNERMQTTGTYLNIIPGIPTKDKRSRARAIQARMRAGGVYFDKSADWYPGFEQELLQFPKGMYKDQVDSIAWLGIAINDLMAGPTTGEVEDDNYESQMESYKEDFQFGRSNITGY
jgi:predicted phage terminase large subunit-like protein